MALDQALFRGRNDDGTEAGATWKAPVNTNWTQAVDENLRIRFESIENANKGEKDGVQLQYNKNAAGWNDVNAASLNVRSFSSANFADNTDTTQQLAAGAFAVLNGAMDENNGFANEAGEEQKNNSIEYEFCVQIRSVDVVNNDTIQLRLVRAGGAGVFDTYTQTPTVTVNAASNVTLTPAANAAVFAAVAATLAVSSIILTPAANTSVLAQTTPVISNALMVMPTVNVSAFSQAVHALVKSAITLTPAVNVSAFSQAVHALVKSAITLTPAVNASAFSQPSHVAVIGALTITPTVNASAFSQAVHAIVKSAITLTPGVNASALSSTAAIASNGNSITPTVSTFASSQPSPSIVAGAITLTPGVNAMAASQAAVLALAGAVNVAPSANSPLFSQGTVGLTNSATIAPAAVAAVFAQAVPVVTNLSGQTITPTANASVLSQPAHAVSIALSITPSANAMTLGQVAHALAGSNVLTPATVVAAFSQAASTITGSIAVQPSANVVSTSQPSVTAIVDAAITPSTNSASLLAVSASALPGGLAITASPIASAFSQQAHFFVPGLVTIDPTVNAALFSQATPVMVVDAILTPGVASFSSTAPVVTVVVGPVALTPSTNTALLSQAAHIALSALTVTTSATVSSFGQPSHSLVQGASVVSPTPQALSFTAAGVALASGAAVLSPAPNAAVLSQATITVAVTSDTITPVANVLSASLPLALLFLGDAPTTAPVPLSAPIGIRPLAGASRVEVGRYPVEDSFSTVSGRMAAMGAAGKLVAVGSASVIGDSVLGMISANIPSGNGATLAVVHQGTFFIQASSVLGALPGCRLYTSDGLSVHALKRTGDLFAGTFVSQSGGSALVRVAPSVGFVPPSFADNTNIGQSVSLPLSVPATSYSGGSSFSGVVGPGTVTIDGTSAMVVAPLASGSTGGVAGAGSTTTLVVKPTGAANWVVSDLVGSFIKVTSGVSSGRVVPVHSNSTTTAQVFALPGFAADDLFEIVRCGIDLGVVTINACTAPFVFKGCKIERLISTGNFSITAESCCFDTAHASGSVLSERDSLVTLKDCLADSSASVIVNRATEVAVPGLTLHGATFAVKGGFVSGDIYANGATSTPISFTDCWKVECGCDSSASTGGADGVHIDGCSFAVSGVGLKGSGNSGYGLRVDGVSSRVDATGATLTGTTGDMIVGSTASTWAQLALDGGAMDSGAYVGVGSGFAMAGNVRIISGQFTVNSNFNQSGRMLTFGFQHDSPVVSELSVTAFAGGGQLNATQLSASPVSVVSVVATSGDSVKLVSNHLGLGARKEIVNSSGTSLSFFPAPGHSINGFLDIGLNLPSGARVVCTAVDATNWVAT